jgi:membrane protein implicated in regulation of membrane protease activity
MVDMLGVGLLVTGLALLVIELTYPRYFIGVAGAVGVVIGLLQMIIPSFLETPDGGFAAALVALAAALVSWQFYKRFPSPLNTLGGSPSPDLVGKHGLVEQPIGPNSTLGRVRIDGILWGADATEPIEAGAQIEVQAVRGIHLVVKRREGPEAPTRPPSV